MKICNPKKLDLTMPQHLTEMRWPVTAVLSCGEVTKRSDRALDLKGEQWILAQELVKVLEPFEVATTFLSYEENASLSYLLPILHGSVEFLQKPAEDTPTVQQFKQKVAAEIKRDGNLIHWTLQVHLYLHQYLMADSRYSRNFLMKLR